MIRSSDITFYSDHLVICRYGYHVKISSYPYSKITPSSKSRLENLQFVAATKPMVLFSEDNKLIFTSYTWKR